MKMKKMFMLPALAFALAMSAFTMPAAADVAVVVHTDVFAVGQLAGAGAIAPVKATADATNVAGMSSVVGEKVNMAFVHTDVGFVAQGAIAYANAMGCGTCGADGVAKATATNVAGLTNIDVQTKGAAYVHAGTSAVGILQGSGALAIANKTGVAAATNLAGVSSVSVNVD